MTSTKKNSLGGLLVGAGLLAVALPASAQTTLVGFEGATPFTSPTTTVPPVTLNRLGDTGVANSSFGLAATEGTQFAVATTFSNGGGTYAPGAPLYGGAGAVSAGTLWGFMFPGSTTNRLTASNLVTGSAFTFTLAMTAGSTVSFDYRYLTSEERTGGSPDLGFVGVRLGTTGDPVLFQGLGAPSPALVDAPGAVASFDYVSAAWGTFSYTATTAGNYTLGVGVGDGTLEGVQSGLLLDRVAFNAVPEPGTNAALAAGAVLLGLAVWSRQRRVAASQS